MIPVYGNDQATKDFFKTIPSGPSTGPGNSSSRSRRGSGIFEAINENLRRKDEISYGAQEQRKTAKDLAEQYKQKSAFKVSDDVSVDPGYQDPGFTLPGVQGRSFGGLIGTVGGAVVGSAFGNPMMGAQLGGKVGSYF